jgi:hypothetical protein
VGGRLEKIPQERILSAEGHLDWWGRRLAQASDQVGLKERGNFC